MKVFLDAGHGGTDPGAVFERFREKDVTLAVVSQLARAMQGEGSEFHPFLSRSDDSTVSLAERARLANTEKCDVFVSVHCNADPDEDAPGMREASGAEVWIHPNSKRSRLLAELVHEGITKHFPAYPWRGVRESDKLYVLKHTEMPAILIEVGFIDSHHDAEFLTRPPVQALLAQIVLDALVEYAKVP